MGSFLDPLGLFSRDSRPPANTSTSTALSTTSITNQADNRVVLGNGASQIGAFGTANSNNSTTTSVTNFGTDGGSVQIAKFNAELLRSVADDQGETVRFLAQMGADGIGRQAESATRLNATSSATSAAAWGHTVDKSAELIDKLLLTARGTIAGANDVAAQAVASFTPTANKQADAFKYAAIAAAALIAMKFLKA